MRLVFQAETGITIDTLDPVFLSIATGYTTIDGCVVIETTRDRMAVVTLVEACGYVCTTENDNTISVYGVVNELTNTSHAVENVAPTINMEEPTAEPTVHDVQAEIEFSLRETATRYVEANEETIMETLAHIVSPEDGSVIQLHAEKVREYSRIWGKAITITREFDKSMTAINKIDVARRLNVDIEYLLTRRDDINSVKLGEDANIILTTEPITTDDQPEYGRRVLGRLRFTIDLKYLYAPVPPTTNYVNAIRIENLDTLPDFDNREWICGHVYRTQDGNGVCYGGYYQHMFEAFVAGDLPQLVDTLMRFVNRPNENDEWGRAIQAFPEPEDLDEA